MRMFSIEYVLKLLFWLKLQCISQRVIEHWIETLFQAMVFEMKNVHMANPKNIR